MKKRISIGIIIILVLICGGLTGLLHRLYAKQQCLLQAYEQQMIPEIMCIGDSLTAGTGGASYPDYLSEMMNEDRLYIPVRNYGVGGDSTITIAGRMGAIPYKTGAFTIPADVSAVEVPILKEEGRKLELHADVGISPCIIGGVEGRVTIENTLCYFTRSQAGESVNVSEGSEITTYAQTAYTDGIYIIFMGENDGFRDIDDLVYQQRAILNLQEKNHDKYLILGMTSGNAADRSELESRMQEEYGDKYINLREYLSMQGPYDAGVTLTDTDKQQMELGQIPDCLLSDGLHFKPEGYKLIAQIVYARMQQLGYFDEIMETVGNYGGILE